MPRSVVTAPAPEQATGPAVYRPDNPTGGAAVAHQVNRRVVFWCYQAARDDADTPAYPAMDIAGARLEGYLHPGGVLRVSLHCDEAQPPLVADPGPGGERGAVPVEVRVGYDTALWTVDAAGFETYPRLVGQAHAVLAAAARVEDTPVGHTADLAAAVGELVRVSRRFATAVGVAERH